MHGLLDHCRWTDNSFNLTIRPIGNRDRSQIKSKVRWTALPELGQARQSLIQKTTRNLESFGFLWGNLHLPPCAWTATEEGVHPTLAHKEVIIWGDLFSELHGCCRMPSPRAVGNPHQGLGPAIVNHSAATPSCCEQF
jgi:hypothetical protein